MIRFYGSPTSSTGRSHWLLEELGIPYEYTRINIRDGQTGTPEFLALNPAGTVPFLEDGDVKLFESVAINFYLAEKYAPSLWSSGLPERAQIYQWSLWAITNLQPILMDIMNHAALLPEPERNPKVAEKARAKVPRYLEMVEAALGEKQYLVGDTFSVADINVASVVNLAPAVGHSLDAHPLLKAWLHRLKERPAYKRVAAAG